MHSSETIKVVPARYPLRVVGALVALLVLAVVIQSVAFNPRWEWGVFARWFFDPVILEGLGQTLLLTLLGTVLSVIFGGLLALARLSSSWLLSSLAWGYGRAVADAGGAAGRGGGGRFDPAVESALLAALAL